MKGVEPSPPSTKELRRVLNRTDLLSIAIGQTVGPGIFALIGAGIAATGKSVNIAMPLASVLMLTMSIPNILVGGTVRLRGGYYTQLGFFLGKTFAGFYVIIHMVAWFSLGMYAITFAEYAAQGAGINLNKTAIAFLVLTMFYIMNMLGAKNVGRLQRIITPCTLMGLGAFIVFGLPQVVPGYFSGPDFMSQGMRGMLATATMFTWVVGGANSIIQLGAEAKNPTKDIPFVILVTKVTVAVCYALIATIAAGVLPIAETANQPLTTVAARIFPRPIYLFFIIGGVLPAVAGALNVALSWVTKPILQAAVDGWFPPFVARISKKYRTPVVILTFLYGQSLLPVFFHIDVASIANMAVLLTRVCSGLICISVLNMPKRIPEIWAKSKYHCSPKVLYSCCIAGAMSAGIQIISLLREITPKQLTGNIAILVIAVCYAFWRNKSGHVRMEISYEEV